MKKTMKAVAATALTVVGISGTLLAPTNAEAAVVQWDISSGGNGNYYEVIPGQFTVEQAWQLNSTVTYSGIQGHLIATETADETDFLKSLLLGAGIHDTHVAASDAGHEGSWLWTAGPNIGTPVYFGNHQYPWVYYQPDNFWGGQDYAVAFIATDLGLPLGGMVLGNLYWDDGADQGAYAFKASVVIEFESPAPVPLPAAAFLLAPALGGLGLLRRRAA